jgi:hypothetical protein
MLETPNISFAAQEKDPKGIVDLENNTVYKYDLNGDDKVDVIKMKQTTSDEGKTTLKLYINNKLCLTKKTDFDGFDIKVCDLDNKDKNLDLVICEDAANDYVMSTFFTKYNGKTLDSKVAFTPKDIFNNTKDSKTYEIVKLAGDGKFYIRSYTYCDAIGSFYCQMQFQLKKNVIQAVPLDVYQLDENTTTYKYKAAKNFQAFERAGSKKVVYTVKKGNEVTFDRLYISKTGEVYLRLINTSRKSGWIKSDQKGLFVNAFKVG